MSWFKKDKERDRFYLLPGMGGRAAREKHRRILGWSLVFGVFISVGFAAALYFLNQMAR